MEKLQEPFERSWRSVECGGELYTPRTGHTVVEHEGILYLFGGTDKRRRQQDLFKFDPSTQRWEAVRSWGEVPSRRSGAQGVVLGDKMYIFGGYEGREGSYYNDIFSFNFASGEWKLVRPKAVHRDPTEEDEDMFDQFPLGAQYGKPSPRTDHCMVGYRNSLIVFGGFDGYSRFNDTFQFDLDTRKWREMNTGQGSEDRPSRRFGHSGVVFQDKLWVFGGWDGRVTLNCVWALDLQTERWSSLETLQVPRLTRFSSSSSASSSSYLTSLNAGAGGPVTLGKRKDSFESLTDDGENSFSRSNTDSQRLTKAQRAGRNSVIHHERTDSLVSSDAPMIVFQDEDEDDSMELDSTCFMPKNRYRHCAVLHGSSMVVFGGVDKDHHRFNDLQKLDLKTLKWSTVEAVGMAPTPRTFHRAVTVGDRMYVLGGYDGTDRLNDMYSVFLGNLSPAPLSELAAECIRQNVSLLARLGQFHYIAPVVLETAVFTRDSCGNLRGGRWEGNVLVCRRLELPKRPVVVDMQRPFSAGGSSSSEEISDSDSTMSSHEERCVVCGGPAWQHDYIPEETLYMDGPESWQPDHELSSNTNHHPKKCDQEDAMEDEEMISTKDFGCLQFGCFSDEKSCTVAAPVLGSLGGQQEPKKFHKKRNILRRLRGIQTPQDQQMTDALSERLGTTPACSPLAPQHPSRRRR